MQKNIELGKGNAIHSIATLRRIGWENKPNTQVKCNLLDAERKRNVPGNTEKTPFSGYLMYVQDIAYLLFSLSMGDKDNLQSCEYKIEITIFCFGHLPRWCFSVYLYFSEVYLSYFKNK